MLKIWRCEIGAVEDFDLPEGADHPLRVAVARAYRELTGRSCDFNFSGWEPYDTLTRVQREIIAEGNPSSPRTGYAKG